MTVTTLNFGEWKTAYAYRVMLMAEIKTLDAAIEMLPHDDILRECWSAGENPNDAADNEMTGWDE